MFICISVYRVLYGRLDTGFLKPNPKWYPFGYHLNMHVPMIMCSCFESNTSITLSDSVATSEFFTLIWQSHHRHSLSYGMVREWVMPWPTIHGQISRNDITLVNHLSPYTGHMSLHISEVFYLLFIGGPFGPSYLQEGPRFKDICAGLIRFHPMHQRHSVQVDGEYFWTKQQR